VLLACLPIAVFHLIRLIRRQKVDVINCHYLTPHFIHLVIAARLAGVRTVISVQGADIDAYATADWAHKILSRGILRRADCIVACSKALARQVAETFPDVGEKATWVHNGLTLKPHMPAQELAVPTPFLLCVSRHVHKKGIDSLLRAFALVSNELKELSLVLVGDGPLLSEHKVLATRLQVERKVMFAGEVAFEDVPSYFAQCSAYVLPSRAEPFGLVLLEAAYYAKPMVCTSVGGVPEIITNGVDGAMVEPDDPAAMAMEILTILRDRDLGRRLEAMRHAKLLLNDSCGKIASGITSISSRDRLALLCPLLHRKGNRPRAMTSAWLQRTYNEPRTAVSGIGATGCRGADGQANGDALSAGLSPAIAPAPERLSRHGGEHRSQVPISGLEPGSAGREHSVQDEGPVHADGHR
jgi:glycosyltransferase involved in cell wall biosynthesis